MPTGNWIRSERLAESYFGHLNVVKFGRQLILRQVHTINVTDEQQKCRIKNYER